VFAPVARTRRSAAFAFLTRAWRVHKAPVFNDRCSDGRPRPSTAGRAPHLWQLFYLVIPTGAQRSGGTLCLPLWREHACPRLLLFARALGGSVFIDVATGVPARRGTRHNSAPTRTTHTKTRAPAPLRWTEVTDALLNQSHRTLNLTYFFGRDSGGTIPALR